MERRLSSHLRVTISRALLSAAALSVLIAPARADDRIGIGVKAGTLGLGVDLTGRITDWFSLRGTANAADTSRSFDEEEIDYDGDIALGAYGLLADFHPFRGQFRISVGWMKNRNHVDLFAEPTTDIEIGGVVYPPAAVGTVTGDVEFDDSAPYAGVGYGSAPKGPGRVRFLLDVGVMRQGAGDVTLSSSSGLVSEGDLEMEAQEIEDDIADYDLYPVLAFGVSFRLK